MRSNICLLLLAVALAYLSATGGAQQDQDQAAGRPVVGLNRLLSVNVPMFYDMVRNGSSMGLNVLSGLVKVERGDEAERNGLMGNGRRPLSVRIFGVPVFERGTRVRPPKSDAPARPKEVGGEEEDIEPLAD